MSHGIKDDATLEDFAAAVVPYLKSRKSNCAVEVMQAFHDILQLKTKEKERAVGEVSEEAMLGLKALVSLSTASLVGRQGNSELGALYVYASAYTAYNPAGHH